MKAYITNGTGDFLTKIAKKNPDITFSIMLGEGGSLAYYEGTDKEVFTAGRTYDILIQKGDIQEEGFVVMNNIPVTEDGKPVFEDRFKSSNHQVTEMPGFQAFRLLRPHKGNTYVVLTQWKAESDFTNWKESDSFKQTHSNEATKPSAYFADRPFVTKYYMKDPDED